MLPSIGPQKEAGQVECRLNRWFPPAAFIKAAPIDDYPILPEERALVANAVRRRRYEFATGRFLSRQGLRSFGLPDQPIKMGKLRDPLWPGSVLGTISHDGELCVVVLMQKHESADAGIGIDLVSLPQRAGRMDGLANMFVTNGDEIGAMATLNLPVEPALLLFSLKEAVIKAMSFRLTDFIDMRAIEIHLLDKLGVSIAGHPVSADLFADTTGEYLVTAVTAR